MRGYDVKKLVLSIVVGLALLATGYKVLHKPKLSYVDGTAQVEYFMAAQEYDKLYAVARKMVDEGEPKANYYLGMLYDAAWGVEQDKELAVKYYTLAAQADNSWAQTHLATLYFSGEGALPQDIEKTLYWTERSAAHKNPASQLFLGLMYMEGIGVEKNTTKGMWLMRLSQAQGFKAADEQLEKYESRSFARLR